MDGCNPRHSFHWLGESGHLYVFEAPVDMLSFITLNPQEWQRHSYVSLCGVGGQAMLWMLEQYPQLRQVSLCLDNDEAGHKASERLKQQLAEQGYESERLMSQGKDWNDDLTEAAQQKPGSFEMRMS